jgi:hypothetical protein
VIPGSLATAPLRHLLTELARAAHTGALHVDGVPGGTFYLVAGRITYAESPACPDLRARLLRSGRLTAAGWDAAYRTGSAEQAVGRLLVQECGLEHGELVCHVLATICDAGHAVLQTPDAGLRFVPDERHWLGLITQLEPTALGRETERRLLAAARQPTTPAPVHQETAAPESVIVPDPAPPRHPVPNALPRRRTSPPTEGRPRNPDPRVDDARRGAPDYATLKRIRQAFKSAG